MQASGPVEARRRLTGYAIIALVGSLGTFGAYRLARHLDADHLQREFAAQAAAVRAAVVSQLEDALWTLDAIAALWNASREVEPEEFHAFVQPFLIGKPQIEAFEWAPWVPREGLPAVEAEGRRVHGPGFAVHEIAPDGSRVPVGERSVYAPVLLVETARRPEIVPGFDLGSEGTRRAVLDEAAALGTTRLTPPVVLRQGSVEREGFLAVRPVYRGGDASTPPQERRGRLLGFAVGVFEVDRVIELGLPEGAKPRVNFTVRTDGSGEGRVVYRRGSAQEDSPGERLTSSEPIEVGGRRWVVSCVATRELAAASGSTLPWWILAAGAMLTLAVLLVYRERDLRLVELARANASLEREIQERRRAEQERERMQHQLLETQKLESLGILAGGIAHDFNNILTAILGNACLALEHVPRGSAAARSLERVVSASERAALLTRQLLAYAGKGSYRIHPLDLSALVRGLVPLLEASVPKKVQLVLELADGLPFVSADEAQMHQVVLNLVVNGAEACGENAGRVVVRTAVDTEAPEVGVVLEVADDGSGMDDETRARIFDPFFTTKFTGRGLGLAAVLGIVRGHRATLGVVSTPGRGSTFRLVFPPAEDAAPPEPEIAPRPLVPTASRDTTILVVDDETMVLDLARSALEGAGYRVVVAPDGRRAVEVYLERRAEIALVVLDMMMPEMNGEETLRALRRIRPDVTVLLSSGYAEVDVLPAFEEHGLAGFLQKPWLPKELLAKVAEILDHAP